MKGKKFKTLCRRVLGLEPNGFDGEMPDDWNIKILTCNGTEDFDSWDDCHSCKETVLCANSSEESITNIEKRKEMFHQAQIEFMKVLLNRIDPFTADLPILLLRVEKLNDIAKYAATNAVRNTQDFM